MKTKVIFRRFRNGEVIALFPEIKERANEILSYMHIGQHGGATIDVVNITTLAKESEYKPLYNELTAIGYDLETRKRIKRY